MEQKKIIYICNFDGGTCSCELLTQPSANTKIQYIISALFESGYTVDLISTAVPITSYLFKGRTYKTKYGTEQYLFSIGRSDLLRNIISDLLINLQLIRLLLSFTKDTIVLVYHSPRLTRVINYVIKMGKRFRLYIELEELYSVVRNQSEKRRRKEISFLQPAKGYIAVNDHVVNLCGLNDNQVICYGIYNSKRSFSKKINNKIRILYAGGLNEDVDLAIETSKLLSRDYELIIAGYGITSKIRQIQKSIELLPDNCAQVRYVGYLKGTEYDNLLNKCDIGLCSRAVASEDSLYAFPSKIMVYLSKNLLVVSTPLHSIKESSVASRIYFSEDYSASALANAILSASKHVEVIDNSRLLSQLHSDFITGLKELFV